MSGGKWKLTVRTLKSAKGCCFSNIKPVGVVFVYTPVGVTHGGFCLARRVKASIARRARGPGSRVTSCREESPGSTKQGWRVTPAVGNHRESATESIPPMARLREQARVKGCGKSAPGLRQRGPHGKPRPEQGRIGVARSRKRAGVFRPSCKRRPPGLAARAMEQSMAQTNGCRRAAGVPLLALGIPRAEQNPAYRPPGISLHIGPPGGTASPLWRLSAA